MEGVRGTISLALLTLLFGSSQVFAHPSVDLKDVLGNNILDSSGNVVSKLPVSYQKSCSACHDLDFINEGWHSQQGRLSILTSDVYSLYYQKFGDKNFTNGLPQDQSKLWLKWFGPNNIYGPGGMYNRVTVPHMLKLAPYKTTDPLDVDLTTADWDFGKCSICHPGGGYGLKDQKDQPLDQMDMTKVEDGLKNGTYYGDYLMNSVDGSGKLIVQTYHAKAGDVTVPNVRDNDCLVCHAYSYDLANARMTSWKKKHPGWVDTVGARLGTVNADWTVSYDATAVQNFHNLIGSTSNESCARCHAGVSDLNADGKITPYDNIGLFGNLSILTSPGFFKRAQEIGDVAELGSDGLPHKVIDPDKRPQFFDPKTETWKDVPYLDVHAEAGLKCADCHFPVKHEPVSTGGLGYVPNLSAAIPSHDLAKGTDGFNVRSDLDGTITCTKCHTNYLQDHAGVFGPGDATAKHMKYIHCTTCHIPQKFNGVIQTLIRTTEEGKGHLFANFREIEVNGEKKFVTVPFTPDYVWFPDIPAKGQPPTLKVKPANLIAELYWRLSDGRTVPNRFLHMVFKVSPDTWDVNNPNRPEAEFGLTYFKDGKPYIPAKALNNPYVNPGGMVFWAYVGKYGDNVEFTNSDVAQQLGVDDNAPIVGRFRPDGTVDWIDSNNKTGWVVKSTLPNMLENPETGETMIIRKDDAEAPFVDNSDEIQFAAQALEAAIHKITGKTVKVQYVYHLGIFDGSYIMSHNIAPVSSDPQLSGGDAAYAKDPMHVLQCEDCHSSKGRFNRPVQKYPHIDTVPGVTVFEVPKAAIEGYSGDFTQEDLRRLTYAYYSPTDVEVKPYDGNGYIAAVWTPDGANIDPLTAEPDSVDTSFVPQGKQIEEAFKIKLTGSEATFEVIPAVGKASDYSVVAGPNTVIKSTQVEDGRLLFTVATSSKQSDEATVAIVKGAAPSPTPSVPVVPQVTVQNVQDGTANLLVNLNGQKKTIEVEVKNAVIQGAAPETEVQQIAQEKKLAKVIAHLVVVPQSTTFTITFTGLSSDEVQKATVVPDRGIVTNISRDSENGTVIATISLTATKAEEPVTVVLGEFAASGSTSTGGGGGGGCSLTPNAGAGNILSLLFGLLPLGFIRRRKNSREGGA